MPLLNPPHVDLGLFSPAVGPWFGRPATGLPLVDFVLPVPHEHLYVELDSLSEIVWFPPATGTLSLFVATAPRPAGLAGLRRSDGEPAFTDGHFVALFRLLPEVEDRLDRLGAAIASADGQPSLLNQPTRPRVRSFAFELALPSPELRACLNQVMWRSSERCRSAMRRAAMGPGEGAEEARAPSPRGWPGPCEWHGAR